MSGGIAQLVAVGAQDAHLVGNPEVSFFRSSYKRHTNFSQTVERQVIQGNPAPNGMSTVRFERKGDLLGHVYFTAEDGSKSTDVDWSTVVSKVEILIGGQVIDTQDPVFMNGLASYTLANTYAKCSIAANYSPTGNGSWFPLKFFFCENVQSYLPLIALQYHDVELRITWGTEDAPVLQCWANYVYLDTNERETLSATPQKMLITQVQKMLASSSKNQELTFNHPVKFIGSVGNRIHNVDNKIKLQINGVDVSDFKFSKPHFGYVKNYYNTSYADSSTDNQFLYPFCLDTSKLQPTGTLNFSRLDSARIVSQGEISNADIYAVNYNILRIENGMGGLVYSN